MNENKAIQQNYENIFSAYQENINILTNGIRRSVPHYHQSITNIQQEYLHTCENVFHTSIELQKKYMKKIGITAKIPDTGLKILRDVTEQFVKTASVQNQMILSTMDATQENIKMFNENVKSFAEINKTTSQS